MEKDSNYSKFLTSERYHFSRTETIIILNKLELEHKINPQLIEKVNEEDLLLKIKLRTFNKCVRNIIISFFLLIISFMLKNAFPIFFFGIIMGGIIIVSSFFGLISNKLSKIEKKYILN